MRKYSILVMVLSFLGGGLLAACGGGGPAPTLSSRADPAAGQGAYAITCLACHGAEGRGVPGLGKDLTTSEFVKSNSDAELKTFILTGRPSGDPLNTTGIDMPPKGGNPALDDADIENIVAYLRSIQH